MQGHLAAQDVLLTRIAERIGLDPVPIIDADSGDEVTDGPLPPGDQPAAQNPPD